MNWNDDQRDDEGVIGSWAEPVDLRLPPRGPSDPVGWEFGDPFAMPDPAVIGSWAQVPPSVATPDMIRDPQRSPSDAGAPVMGGGGSRYADASDAPEGRPVPGTPPPVTTPSPSTPSTTSPWEAPAAASGAATSSNAPRLTKGEDGVWTLTEHGNSRRLQPNEVADAQTYVTEFWTQNPTGFQSSNQNSLADAYRQFLGREATAAELASHAGNPGGFAGIIATIANSPEAKAYAERRANQNTNTNTNSTTTPPPVSGNPYTGFTPKYAMEGFNFAREQNPGKSAKDAFAYLANRAPAPPLQDKTALAAWFKQYIEPGMNSLGHKVSSVNGDTFTYSNAEGTFTVDYGRGAGAQGGALAWQADPADAATRQRYGGSAPVAASPSPSGPAPTAAARQTPNRVAPSARRPPVSRLAPSARRGVDPQEWLQAVLR